MGRPRKKIDPEVVDRLAAIDCTIDEIASVCGCSRDTIERRFRVRIEAGKAKGRASLRRMQWKSAEAGVPVMLIWLGKQMLGQADLERDRDDAREQGEQSRVRGVVLEGMDHDALIEPDPDPASN